MCRHVGQDAQCDTNNSRVSGTHTIHAVVQVGSIGNARHHKDSDEHEEHPAGSHFIFSAERHDIRVVQIVILEEWYRRL